MVFIDAKDFHQFPLALLNAFRSNFSESHRYAVHHKCSTYRIHQKLINITPAAVPPSIKCEDKIQNCVGHRKNGGCLEANENHKYWRTQCVKTCEYCGNPRYNGTSEGESVSATEREGKAPNQSSPSPTLKVSIIAALGPGFGLGSVQCQG